MTTTRSESVLSVDAPPRVRKRSLTQRGALNAIARGLEYGARVGVGFVLNPLLVDGLGSFGFGAWQVLRRLVGYAGPTTGRPGHALRWTLANRQSSTDYDEKRRYVGSAATVWLIFLPAMLILGGLLSWFAPQWLRVPATLVWPVRLAAGLLVVRMAITSLGELPRSVLEGENLGYKRMGWSAGLVLVGGGLTALALFLDLGLVGVAGAAAAASIVTAIFFLLVARAYIPWFGIRRSAPGAARRFLGLSGWFLAWHGVLTLMRASDVVVLGMFASVELVTDYTLTKYLPETLTSLVAIVVFGVTPGLGGIIGTGNLPKAAQIRREIMSFSWLLLTAAGTTILLWNEAFVNVWVGEAFAAGPTATLLIVLLVIQFVLFRNDAVIIDLTLDLRAKVLLGLASATVSVILALVFVTVWDNGIVGLCSGFILGRGILTVTYPWLVSRRLEIRPDHELRGVLRPAVVTAALFAPALGLGSILTASGWSAVVGGGGATFALTALIAFYAGLRADARQQLVHRLRVATRPKAGTK